MPHNTDKPNGNGNGAEKNAVNLTDDARKASDKAFLTGLSEKFGEDPIFLSLENGQIDRDSMSYYSGSFNNSFYINRKDGAADGWACYERAEDGKFKEKKLTQEEKEKIANLYLIRTNKDYQEQIIGPISEKGIFRSCSGNGTTIEFDSEKNLADSVWIYLLNHGSFYYSANDDRDNHHKIELDGAEIKTTFLMGDEFAFEMQDMFSNELKNYHSANKIPYTSDSLNFESNLLSRERNDAGGSAGLIDTCVIDLKKLLHESTRTGHSSSQYKMIEKALNDYDETSIRLTAEERYAMLLSIASLADNWIHDRADRADYLPKKGKEGKGGKDEKELTYHEKRFAAVSKVRSDIRMMASAIKAIEGVGTPMSDRVYDGYAYREHKWTLDAEKAEKCMQTARRAIRGRLFSNYSYALWKSVTLLTAGKKSSQIRISQEDRKKKFEEILNSPANALIGAYNLTEDSENVKDEHQADRIYESATKTITIIDKIRKCSNEDFIKAYKEILKNNNKKYYSGLASFDSYIREQILRECILQVHKRNMELDKNQNLVENFDGTVLTRTNRHIMLQLADFNELHETGQMAEEEKTLTNDRLAMSVFGMSYSSVQKLFSGKLKNGYDSRQVPGVIMVAVLMAKQPDGAGLTLEEIFNPQTGLQEKEALGKRILEDFAKPEQERKYTKDTIDRMAVENLEAMHKYLMDKNKARNINDRNSMIDFIKETGPLSDGLFDFFGQRIQNTEMWTKNKEKYLRLFGHEGETAQETMERVDKLLYMPNISGFHIKALNNRISYYDDLRNLLEKPHISDNEISKLPQKFVDVYRNKYFYEAVRDLDMPSSAKEIRYYSHNLRNITDNISGKLLANVLSGLSVHDHLLLLTDGEAAERISIKFKPQALGSRMIDNVPDYDKYCDFVDITLHLKSGKKLLLTNDMLNGKALTKGQQEFMYDFIKDLQELGIQRTDRDNKKLKNKGTELINTSLPQNMGKIRTLFSKYPQEMGSLYAALETNTRLIIEAGLETKDAAGYVIIGNKDAESILRQEATKFGVNYENLGISTRNLLLSAYCLAAMRRGQPVTMLNLTAKRNLDNNKKVNKTSLDMPSTFKGKLTDKDTRKLLDNLWSAMNVRNDFPVKDPDAGENQPDPVHDAHEKCIAGMIDKIHFVTNGFYKDNAKKVQELSARSLSVYITTGKWDCKDFILNRENTDKIINSRESLRNEIIKRVTDKIYGSILNGHAAGQNAQGIPVYKFEDGTSLDPALAIMAFACDKLISDQAGGNGAPVFRDSWFKVPFDDTVKAAIDHAGEEYIGYCNVFAKSDHKETDSKLRNIILNAASNLYQEPKEGPAADVIGRMQANAGKIFLNQGLLDFIERDKGIITYTNTMNQKASGRLRDIINERNINIFNRQEYADITFYQAAEKMKSFYSGNKTMLEDINEVNELLGSYIFQKNISDLADLKGKCKLSDFVKMKNEEKNFTKLMLSNNKLSKIIPEGIFNDQIREKTIVLNNLVKESKQTFYKVFENAMQSKNKAEQEEKAGKEADAKEIAGKEAAGKAKGEAEIGKNVKDNPAAAADAGKQAKGPGQAAEAGKQPKGPGQVLEAGKQPKEIQKELIVLVK